MNKPIGPDLYRCSKCNDLTGMSDGPCGRCAMSHPAPQPTTVTKCALCDLAFTSRPDGFVDEDLEREAADHHAVCPKRPIAVGDYVRWEYGPTGYFAMPTNWVDGEVTAIDPYLASIRVQRCGMEQRAGKVHVFGVGSGCGSIIRRIPRPAEAQATIRTPVGDIKITADPTLKPGEFCVEERKYRPVVVDKTAMERAMKDEKLMQRLQEETEKRVQYLVTGVTKAHTLEPPPALIDGLTREQCTVRWLENRLAVEGGAAPPNAMTRMQRDVGHAMWLAGPGAKWSAELRAKVAADREAERYRVTYCEVDPCD